MAKVEKSKPSLGEYKKSSVNSEHIIEDKLLREQNFGIFENESYDVENAAVKKYGANFTPENGESDITGDFFEWPIHIMVT